MKSPLKVMGLALVLTAPTLFCPPASAESFSVYDQVERAFPEIVREMKADCQGSKWLQRRLSEKGNRVYFRCWDAPDSSGSRSGTSLGTLPLSSMDQSFKGAKLECGGSDAEACKTVRARLQTQFPKELEAAEFKCAFKGGQLDFDPSSQVNPDAQEVMLACLFYVSSLTDDNGDGNVDHESFGSTLIPVLNVKFTDSPTTNNVQTPQQQEWDAFFSSQYTYWDAKVLSNFWNQSVGDAKARIGRKLLWGRSDQAILDQFLVDARVQALQSAESLDLYAESSYDYDDAQALASFWGDSTPYEAKVRIERNLIMGNEKVVKDALQFAGRS